MSDNGQQSTNFPSVENPYNCSFGVKHDLNIIWGLSPGGHFNDGLIFGPWGVVHREVTHFPVQSPWQIKLLKCKFCLAKRAIGSNMSVSFSVSKQNTVPSRGRRPPQPYSGPMFTREDMAKGRGFPCPTKCQTMFSCLPFSAWVPYKKATRRKDKIMTFDSSLSLWSQYETDFTLSLVWKDRRVKATGGTNFNQAVKRHRRWWDGD